MELLIYFTGFFVVYYTMRYLAKKENDWTWSSFRIVLCYALCSWIGFFIMLGIFIWYTLNKKINGEPPRWL